MTDAEKTFLLAMYVLDLKEKGCAPQLYMQALRSGFIASLMDVRIFNHEGFMEVRKTEYRYQARKINAQKNGRVKWPVTFTMLEDMHKKEWVRMTLSAGMRIYVGRALRGVRGGGVQLPTQGVDEYDGPGMAFVAGSR